MNRPITRVLRRISAALPSCPATVGDPCPELRTRFADIASRGPWPVDDDAVPSSRAEAIAGQLRWHEPEDERLLTYDEESDNDDHRRGI